MKKYNIVYDVPNPLEDKIWQKDFYERIPFILFQDAFLQDYT